MDEMPDPQVTRVVEDYLPMIWVVDDYLPMIWKAFEWPGGTPTTTDLASRLGVTASTVSATLKKLARDGFIVYEPYGAIELTQAGRRVAVEIVRRHRILETYLQQQLGLPWDAVHAEADRLEHAVSDTVLARMHELLGHPSSDPHGDPIPDADGTLAADRSRALTDVQPGTAVRVARVSDRSSEVLRHLDGLGIAIGTELRVDEVNLEAGAVGVTVAGAAVQLGLQAADAVRVLPA